MIVQAVVEDPRGSTRRHAWDPASHSWREWAHPLARSPWPASYGFLPGTLNPADGDALDVIVLAADALATGTRLAVRVVGLCPRPDGDHKVLAVAATDPRYAHVARLADVPTEDLAAIEHWFREWTTIAGWEDEAAAARLVATMGGEAIR